jgi:hypothetical protein
MKSLHLLMGATLASVLAGCSTVPLVTAPVGPNPLGSASEVSTGILQVFSRVGEQSDDQNQGEDDSPFWHQHTDYTICHLDGKLVKRVGNTIGHYAEAPAPVVLPAGRYLVKAQADDYSWLELPVEIKPGRTTRVHLDDKWNLPPETPKSELVTLPDGNPVGWRADYTK